MEWPQKYFLWNGGKEPIRDFCILQLTELGNAIQKHKNKRRKLDTHPRKTKYPKSNQELPARREM
jgi:hypothetical protein